MVNKIFFCSSSPSPCLWHLHQLQETMNSRTITKLETRVHRRRLVLAWPAVWKQTPKPAENSCSLFSSDSEYQNPRLSFKHQYSWVSLVLGMSKPWVHSVAIPLWPRAHFPHWQSKSSVQLQSSWRHRELQTPLWLSPFAVIACLDSKDV